MSDRDPYEVLGVRRNASEDDIKETYRRLAMKYHPDRNQGDKAAEAKFKEVNEAYDILKNAGQRAACDRHGHAAFEQDAAPSGSGLEFIFSGGSFEFVFEGRSGHIGGTYSRQQQASRADLRTHIGVTPAEELDRAKGTARVPSSSVAREPSGDDPGAEPGSAPAQTCRGAGREPHDRTLSVSPLAGAENGTCTQSAGESEVRAPGAPANDLNMDPGARAQPPFQCDEGDIFVHVSPRMTEVPPDVPLEVPVLGGASAGASVLEGSRTGGQPRLRSKHILVLLILLLGGALIYAGTPSGGLRLAAHDPGPIAASIVPTPVLLEVAEASMAPGAVPASETTPPLEIPTSALPAAAPADPSAGSRPPPVTQAGPSVIPSSPALPPDAAAGAALFTALMRTGDTAMQHGDITGARSRYERAAAIQPASSVASILAGKTYDPNVLSLMRVRNASLADATRAREWYARAHALGDPAATELLARLR
jgi:molecular chaperone DnaJ